MNEFGLSSMELCPKNSDTDDVANQEAEINDRVYRLFGLSREEIGLIEED